ncbi:MAG: toxin-antitoxin system YwqK family antitoxin [Flavobacteriales bacterium]|nr:toxin-antitoxin system YwqK family antitoxin [Flavobacteriales bacterium]MEB2342837.1 toxin-antitoxin system YwqK family antitoxin [Flavobacteriia bacterium]
MHLRLLALAGFSAAAICLVAQSADGPINQTDAQGRKQGTWVRKWAESDQVRYTGQFKDDKPVGSFVYYSTKGKVESRVDHYPDGKAAHGIHFHPNGKVMAEGRYVGQQKDSTWNYYGEDGILRSSELWKAGKLNGAVTTFFKDGAVAERKTYRNGVLEGLSEQFFPGGKIRYRAQFAGGEPEGRETFFFPNGNKEIEGGYVNGSRDGVWRYYNEDGSVQLQALYAQGRLVKKKYENGTFTEYWDDGQPKSEVTYKNGKREGPFTEWYDNGKWVNVPVKVGPQGAEKPDMERKLTGQGKKREGTYRNDLLNGPVKEYDEKGRLTSNLTFLNGEPAKDGSRP